ncbi:trehalose-phosphatase [Microbacterium indicum]|uniref:trehalose-phosphatase n=1 Tax=Microbacterium indicum TaxID=358100 RepID=UPI000416410D|nr:trehalose-phosphatase [Microbacterium indicum]
MTSLDEALEVLASAPRILVALDFDGTLSPLVDDPMAARATPEAKAAVERLVACEGVTVAYVSGRTLAALRVISEHDDASRVWLAGSHGAEHLRPAGAPPRMRPTAQRDDRLRGQAEGIRSDAHAAVADLEGAWIEDKEFGLAVHTRLAAADAAAEAQRRIDELMAERAPSWRRREGKNVVEFSWRHEGKDTAIAELREAVAADAVLFAGDDVTDEDALRSLVEGDLGIRVGAGETSARFTVDGIADLAAVLNRLASYRAS